MDTRRPSDRVAPRLPGVDLYLWLRLVVAVLLAGAVLTTALLVL